MIKLRGWRWALCGPIFSAVDGNGCAAVVSVDHAVRIVGVHPQTVMIAVGRVQAIPGLAAIHGAEEASIRDIDGVYIFRISPDMGEIPGALAETVVVGNERPVLATVVGAIESTFFCFKEA